MDVFLSGLIFVLVILLVYLFSLLPRSLREEQRTKVQHKPLARDQKKAKMKSHMYGDDPTPSMEKTTRHRGGMGFMSFLFFDLFIDEDRDRKVLSDKTESYEEPLELSEDFFEDDFDLFE